MVAIVSGTLTNDGAGVGVGNCDGGNHDHGSDGIKW